MYRTRWDSNPPSEYIIAGRRDKDLGFISIPLSNQTAQTNSKLTVQMYTVLREIVTDTIDIQSLRPAIEACQAVMK
jgi:hypothetical protein